MTLEIASLQPNVLHCLTLCLEDNESCNTFPDTGGFLILMKLLASDDIKIKKMVGYVIQKLAKIGKAPLE